MGHETEAPYCSSANAPWGNRRTAKDMWGTHHTKPPPYYTSQHSLAYIRLWPAVVDDVTVGSRYEWSLKRTRTNSDLGTKTNSYRHSITWGNYKHAYNDEDNINTKHMISQ